MVRDATPEEIAAIFLANTDTWACVLERDGQVKGHVCLTNQGTQILGHEMECDSDDPADALRLWRYAEKHAVAAGFDRVHIHITPETQERIKQFWLGRGAREVFTMYELMLTVGHDRNVHNIAL